MNNSENKTDIKKYLISILLVFGTIAITWFGFRIYQNHEDNKVSKSYLISEKVLSKEIKSIDEVVDVFSEAPNKYFILISYTGNKDTYNLEKKLSTVIKKHKLEDQIYYLDVTDIKDDSNVLDKINSSLGLENKKVTQIPTIIYYNNGEVIDIVKRQDDNMMTSGDFEKLLDVNKITE